MTAKSFSDPKFAEYTRRNIDGGQITTGGIDVLVVPSFIKYCRKSPRQLEERANDFMLYDDMGLMVPNEKRTADAKKRIAQAAPTVMCDRSGKVYARLQGEPLEYLLFQSGSGILEPSRSSDYVFTREAALNYAMKAGICDRTEFRDAEESGRLNFFWFKYFQGKASQIKRQRQPKLYLLSEINRLKN